MKGVEGTPFSGVFERIGSKMSCDSVVGVRRMTGEPEVVVKWSRKSFPSTAEARKVATFVKRSYELYELALGPEYLVSSQFLLGETGSAGHFKPRVFITQEYVSGWDGKSLPLDLREDPRLVQQWDQLRSRLWLLYGSAGEVNSQYTEESGARFPITLTVGSSRSMAWDPEYGKRVPATPNLVIDRGGLGIKICDFGEYKAWTDTMAPAYNEIKDRLTRFFS